MNKSIYVLKEGVLNDNLLEIPKKGYIFKNGIIAIIKEYTFENSWNDKLTIKKFKKESSLVMYLNKNYKNLHLEFNIRNLTYYTNN